MKVNNKVPFAINVVQDKPGFTALSISLSLWIISGLSLSATWSSVWHISLVIEVLISFKFEPSAAGECIVWFSKTFSVSLKWIFCPIFLLQWFRVPSLVLFLYCTTLSENHFNISQRKQSCIRACRWLKSTLSLCAFALSAIRVNFKRQNDYFAVQQASAL